MESCPQRNSSPRSCKNSAAVLMAAIVMIGLPESLRAIHCRTVRLPLQCQTNLLATGLVPPAARTMLSTALGRTEWRPPSQRAKLVPQGKGQCGNRN
jgi:hypothetical protein